LQVQLDKAALPAGELEFGGQSVHVEVGTPSNSISSITASSITIQEATNPDETTL
jgi:N-acetylglucosamine-6-phosphate deacetylase